MNNFRLQKLQQQIKHPVLIKKKENLLYLTGSSFSQAEGLLLVTKKDVVFFGSGLEKIEGVKKIDRLKNIGKYISGTRQLDIGYDFTYGEGEYIKLKVGNSNLTVLPALSELDKLRKVKETEEILLIKKSMQIVEKVFTLVKKEIKKPGITEFKLAKFIEEQGLLLGAEEVSFPAIVASGLNAVVPHHVPGSKKLKPGESIILDFGFKYKGYCSDFTRTVFLKFAPKKLSIVYEQVEKAYNKCFTAAVKGESAGNLYNLAAEVLAEKKLEKYFIHSLGHGTGLEIHELPNLSPGEVEKMENNFVFSIEPGVYIPKLGGVRIEDLVYIENGICKKFIKVPTQLNHNIL